MCGQLLTTSGRSTARAATTSSPDFVQQTWPAIIFCRTRHGSDRLVKQLGRLGVESVAIHGGLGQNQRNRALEQFAAGRVHALVATDVAARGIHVDGVASVVHYDPPEDHKAYVHRSGRTARAGAGGVVLSLVQPEQMKDTRRLQREVGLDGEITAPDQRAIPTDGAASRVLAPAAQPRRVRRRCPSESGRLGAVLGRPRASVPTGRRVANTCSRDTRERQAGGSPASIQPRRRTVTI